MKFLAAIFILLGSTSALFFHDLNEGAGEKDAVPKFAQKSKPDAKAQSAPSEPAHRAADDSKRESDSTALGAWRANLRRRKDDVSPRAIVRLADARGSSSPNYIYAACRKGKVSFWVDFNHEFDADEKQLPVLVKLDGLPTTSITMKTSYHDRSIGIWEDRPSRNFLAGLPRHSQLELIVRSKVDGNIVSTFEIAKVENALKLVADACYWRLPEIAR